jgi:multidrug efflux pump subunit AcrA (membrane-fusion protein)
MRAAAAAPALAPETAPPPRTRRPRRILRRLLILSLAALPLAAAGWGIYRLYRTVGQTGPRVPVTKVRRGDITITVTSKGQLQGGNPEALQAPMTGMGEMQIKFLRKAGELVKSGDVVVEFDTGQQAYKLKEAEADLAEADQQVIKAKAEAEAQAEENAYALLKAKSDVRLAELEVRRNPLVSAITARQNDLALEAARDRLAQLEHDLANRSASNQAGVEIQLAARSKSETQAATARRNIEQMVIRAHSDGYVSIRQNSDSTNWITRGMTLPPFRVGDRVSPGVAIAEIPDLKNWELNASIGELDRGHLAVGQAVELQVIALPFRRFHGHVKNIGGTTGPPWDRRFECRSVVDDPAPELRPGMNAELVITTEVMKNVLSIPGQALFEADGRKFVYVPSGAGFAPRDVTLVRRSESQVVITGVAEGQAVALASPDEQTKKQSGGASAMKAIPK